MKILFVIHDTSLTGATIALLRYISWLKTETNCETHFLLPYHSHFDEHYKKLGKVFYWLNEDNKESKPSTGIFFKRKKENFKSTDWIQKQIKIFIKENYDIIYGNTIVVIDTINKLKSLRKPIIWHIHENELSVKNYDENSLKSHQVANKIIATSLYTYNYLINNWKIPSSQIVIHEPAISINTVQNTINELPENCFIIGTSGSGLEQKGMSIFIILTKILETKFKNNKFFYVWIGAELKDPNIRFDLEQTKLISKFRFTGLISNPFDYYKQIDLFVSCSREESFGLSIAECASLNIPFLCFPTNGLLQYFENKDNFCVNYLDLNAMADRIIELFINKSERTRLGIIAGDICKKFDIEFLGNNWYTTLKSVIK